MNELVPSVIVRLRVVLRETDSDRIEVLLGRVCDVEVVSLGRVAVTGSSSVGVASGRIVTVGVIALFVFSLVRESVGVGSERLSDGVGEAVAPDGVASDVSDGVAKVVTLRVPDSVMEAEGVVLMVKVGVTEPAERLESIVALPTDLDGEFVRLVAVGLRLIVSEAVTGAVKVRRLTLMSGERVTVGEGPVFECVTSLEPVIVAVGPVASTESVAEAVMGSLYV